MAGTAGPKVTTKNLVYYVDFANPSCYASGSGYAGSVNSFTDLTGFTNVPGGSGQGTLYAGAVWDPEAGGCVYFDGTNDHAINGGALQINNQLGWASVTSSETPVPNTDQYQMSTELSIDFWYYNYGVVDGGYILSKPWDGSGRYNWYLNCTGIFYVFLHPDAGGNVSKNTNGVIGGTGNYIYNQPEGWIHLHYWVTQTEIGQYYNGGNLLNVSDTHTLANTPQGNYNNKLWLVLNTQYAYGGAWGGSTAVAANGKIAQLRIYNRALSASEVRQNFNATRDKFGV